MAQSKATQADIAGRRTQLIRLRREGVSFDDQRILDLGYSSRKSASKDLIRALEKRRDEQSAEASVYRQQENERLDALLESVWPRATTLSPVLGKDGVVVSHELDMKAVETVLKLMDRRAKLNGLDMPVRTEISGPDGGEIPFSSGDLAEMKKLIAISDQPDAPVPDFGHGDEDEGEPEEDEDPDDDDDDNQ